MQISRREVEYHKKKKQEFCYSVQDDVIGSKEQRESSRIQEIR
jgi:hypothetical protein